MNEKYGFVLALLSMAILIAAPASADNIKDGKVCAVYFTGVGCPHCAKTDPVVLPETTGKYQDFVVVEYEIYQLRENAPLLQEYNSKHGTDLGVPQIIFDDEDFIVGDRLILNKIEGKIKNLESNPCLAMDKAVSFENLNLSKLPGKPKIWMNDRILIKEDSGNEIKEVDPKPVALSGSEVNFENALKVGGWRFQWNGEEIYTVKNSCENKSLVPNSEDLKNLLTDEDINQTAKSMDYRCLDKENNKNKNDKEENKTGGFGTTTVSIIATLAIIGIVIAWGLKR